MTDKSLVDQEFILVLKYCKFKQVKIVILRQEKKTTTQIKEINKKIFVMYKII